MLNHITLEISDKEASKKVWEENNQLRFSLLHQFILIGGILQLILIVLKVMGNWFEFFKIGTAVLIFIVYLLLQKCGIKFLDNFITTILYCQFATFELLSAQEGVFPSFVQKVSFDKALSNQLFVFYFFTIIENEMRINVAKIPVFLTLSFFMLHQ